MHNKCPEPHIRAETADDASRRALSELAGLMALTSEAILTFDRDLRIRGVSRGAANIFGYEASELIGESIDVLLPERYHSQHRHHMEAFIADPEASRSMAGRQPIVGLRKSGEEFPAKASIAKTGSGADLALVCVLRDISEDVAVHEKILHAKMAAESANHAKSQFLATMSHELRTPLNAIIGFSEVIARQMFQSDMERYARYAADIHASGQHLLSIINEILDLSKIESRSSELSNDVITLKSLVDECLMLTRQRADDKHLKFETSIQADLPQIRADRRLIKQAILNILSNAIKFTPDGGVVALNVSQTEDSILITVADTGIGIAPKHLQHIFEPFYQGRTAQVREVEGTGLGLSITKAICERHGGRFRLQSTLGKGTIAQIVIPQSRMIQSA